MAFIDLCPPPYCTSVHSAHVYWKGTWYCNFAVYLEPVRNETYVLNWFHVKSEHRKNSVVSKKKFCEMTSSVCSLIITLHSRIFHVWERKITRFCSFDGGWRSPNMRVRIFDSCYIILKLRSKLSLGYLDATYILSLFMSVSTVQ